VVIATDGCNVMDRHNFLSQKLEAKILSFVSVNTGADPGERLERSPPLKPTKVTLFTMIWYNSENSIRNIIRKTVSVIRLDYKILLKSPP